MGLLSYIFVYNLIILLYVRDMRRFFIFLKNFAIVISNNIYLDSKFTNVGQPKYCYYHRQTTTPKTHSKKKRTIFNRSIISFNWNNIFAGNLIFVAHYRYLCLIPFPLPKQKKINKKNVR